MFDIFEAMKLSLVCREFKEAVAENHEGLSLLPCRGENRFLFDGMILVNALQVSDWKTCFPNASLYRVTGILMTQLFCWV